MSSSVEAAPPKGRRSEGPSSAPPAKSKKKPRPTVPEVEPKAAKRKEKATRARGTEPPALKADAPKADAPKAGPRSTDKRRTTRPGDERRAAVDARAETQPEAQIAQVAAEEAEARLARATDERPARRGLVVVRGGSRGDGAQVWAILALAASVIGAAVAIGLQPAEERQGPRAEGGAEVALQPAAAPVAAPEPRARPARRTPAPDGPGAATDEDLAEAVETLLAAGRERGAIELLAGARPSPTATRARERVLARAREVLDAAAGELRASAGRGEPSAPRLARLRARLPESLATELDALAAELSAIEGLAAAKASSRPPAVGSEAPAPAQEEPEPIPVGPLAGRRMPPRPEPAAEPSRPEPAEPSEPSAPAEPEPARREPEPEPRPSRPEPDAPTGTDEPSPDADAVLAAALKDRLKASHRVRDGGFEVDYCFTSDSDRQDWDGRGWDKFEVNGVMGLATNHTSSAIALELGAGSNGAGVLQHALELAGDYTLEVNCWVAHSSARSQFVILAGKGGGVRWGTQLVKVSRGGGLKPLGPEPDRMGFRGERDVTIKVVRKGDTLEATLNGASTGVKTFKPGELDGKVGVFASDVRLVITRFRITGKVDPRKL